jgi:hypothetical protein
VTRNGDRGNMFDIEVTIDNEQPADYVAIHLHGSLLDVSVSPKCSADALAFLAPQIAVAVLDALGATITDEHEKP